MADTIKTVLKGINGKLMAGPGGASPTAALENVSDVQLKSSWQTGEASHRGGGDVALVAPTLREYELSWKMLDIDGDPDVKKVRDAHATGAPLALKDLDKENGYGIDGDFLIVGFDRSANNKDLVEYNASAKPTVGRKLVVIESTGSV